MPITRPGLKIDQPHELLVEIFLPEWFNSAKSQLRTNTPVPPGVNCAGAHRVDARRSRGGLGLSLPLQGGLGQPRGGFSLPLQDGPERLVPGTPPTPIQEQKKEQT